MNLKFDINKLKNRFENTINSLLSLDFKPEITIIAGSGISNALIDLQVVHRIPFKDFKELADTNIEGHNKEIIFGIIDSKKVLVFNGRFHIYEGLDLELIVAPIILSYFLNCKNLILTNATGGLNKNFNVGDIMLIQNNVNLTNSFIFQNDRIKFEEFYDQIWMNSIKNELNLRNQKFVLGNYSAVTGPSYETPAEIRMLRKLEVDSIGMSIIHEAIVAKLLGFRISACSLITNLLSDTERKELSHKEVLEIAELSKISINNYILSALNTI